MAACQACAAEPPKPYGPVPSPRQLAWHRLELYGFMHFGPNTFTNREWGFGDDKPEVFNPTAFDADQIVRAVRDGGLRGVILTAKHHDGFCLWPTAHTEHCVRNSPWRNGQGDVVKEIADACARHGLKFGVYVSPWDRNHPDYGGPGYVDYYKKTIRELLTGYGPIFEMWFDGASGGSGWYGGKKGTFRIDYDTYYDWKGIREIIRGLQPGCAIWCGQYAEGDRMVYADCRWGGSESGHLADPAWNAMESRKKRRASEKSGARDGDVWCPPEGDTSIRPGWFYHADQDARVKTPGTLMDIYFGSIGRGGNLILNVPPDPRGLIHENDVRALRGFRELMEQTFRDDLARGATATASNVRGADPSFAAGRLTDGDRDTYWATDDRVTTPDVVLAFEKPVTFNVVRLREHLPLGQRVDEWAVDCSVAGQWKELAKGAAIGNCRLVRSATMISTDKIRLRIVKAAACPALAEIGVFAEPARLSVPKIGRGRNGVVTIAPDGGHAEIRYTLDGRDPGRDSPVYTGPLEFPRGGTVKARTVATDGRAMSEIATEAFEQAKQRWRVVSATSDLAGKNGARAIDDHPNPWVAGDAPQQIVVNMSEEVTVRGFTYLPRQDGRPGGMTDRYRFYLSGDGRSWGEAVAEGEFDNLRHNPVKQSVRFSPQKARYFKFVGTRAVEGKQITVAELGVISE